MSLRSFSELLIRQTAFRIRTQWALHAAEKLAPARFCKSFVSVVHPRSRPAKDETVPHSSSAFCSMSGSRRRPDIEQFSSRFFLVLHWRCRPTGDETVAPISRSAVVWASPPALSQTGQPCFLSVHDRQASLRKSFVSVVHPRSRPAKDETVPHSSSAFCSMSGSRRRPDIEQFSSRLFLVLHWRCRPKGDETVAPISRSAVVWASPPALVRPDRDRF